MKKACAALLAAAMLLLVGCETTGLNPQNLMRPPRATGEKEEIHQLLESKAGGTLSLKYPRRGDHRAAIVFHDFSGDGADEAMGFYQNNTKDSNNAGGITVIFMGKSGEEWQEVGSFSNAATQVDKICFGDVNRDGRQEVVIGWGSGLNNTATVGIYSYGDGKMTELTYTQSYNEMEVGDFDHDSYEEIFTATVSTAEQPAIARLLRVTDSMVETIGSAYLDTGVTNYVNVAAGLINEKQYGVMLDGAKSAGTYVTEVLYWDNKEKLLQSPFFDAGTLAANYTLRNINVNCQDINGDKIIELPIVNLLPGFTAPASDETCYLTNWYRYDSGQNSVIRVMSMAINREDGYWLMIPDIWRGKITTKVDREQDSLTFYEWITDEDGNNGASGPALLKLQVFTRAEWNEGSLTSEFYKLTEENGMVYAAAVLQPHNPLALAIGDVQNSFALIDSN